MTVSNQCFPTKFVTRQGAQRSAHTAIAVKRTSSLLSFVPRRGAKRSALPPSIGHRRTVHHHVFLVVEIHGTLPRQHRLHHESVLAIDRIFGLRIDRRG